jgi:hypothetical protein
MTAAGISHQKPGKGPKLSNATRWDTHHQISPHIFNIYQQPFFFTWLRASWYWKIPDPRSVTDGPCAYLPLRCCVSSWLGAKETDDSWFVLHQ